jgi:hypothetical protein
MESFALQSIPFDDLVFAFYWVSVSIPFDNSAFISKSTGQVYYTSSSHDVDDELPDDCEDASWYWTVPHKNDLDLGRSLAFQFVDEYLPDQARAVQDIFHRRSAKDLFQRKGRLEAWFEYERVATESALLAWAREEGLPVMPPRRRVRA